MLLDHGANIHMKTDEGDWRYSKKGSSALHFAVEKSDSYSRDIEHTIDCNLKMVELLVKREADINAATNEGTTALNLAILNRKADSPIIFYLIDNGANPGHVRLF